MTQKDAELEDWVRTLEEFARRVSRTQAFGSLQVFFEGGRIARVRYERNSKSAKEFRALVDDLPPDTG